MAKSRVKWSIEADYVQACNCDAGCPCEFQAPPTLGYCEGMGAWKIRKGAYGAVDLAGLCFGFAAHWPKPLHEGGGTGAFFLDDRASPKQRDALERIVTGAAGGMPFEVLLQTFSKTHAPREVPFVFEGKGRTRSVRMGDAVVVGVEPIRNPVTGATEDVAIDHKTGFVFQKADVVLAREMTVAAGDLRFSWPGKGGFVSKVKYAS
ncbi:MAG: DUF1326 domain-containing protein [Candidatus Methylomirabilis sp.]|nr:DUF1326 domain-containing protein [Deltaproteobacteria bacterium]